VGKFYLRQDSPEETPFIELDELRIGVNWAQVTPKAAQITFNPANAETGVSEQVSPMIYYINPVKQVGGAALEDADLASLLTFKIGDATGADVGFSATISEDKMAITVDPAEDLDLETTYYLAIGDVENESGVLVKGMSSFFTTRVAEDVSSLSELLYNEIPVPDFSAEVLSYDVVLDYGTTEIPVLSWTLTDANATAEVNNLTEFPGTSTVTVTAEDGTSNSIYEINFSVSATQSSDATLKEIRINGELLKGFDPGIYEYQVALPYGTTNPAIISAAANSAVATVEYFQPVSTTSLGGVTVTAQDGTESQYAIFFSLNPYIYTVGWDKKELPFEGWTETNTIVSNNFGNEPITNHGEFEGDFAYRFICPKSTSGSPSGWMSTAMYPRSGILRFWLYVQLPDGNEALTISTHTKGEADTVAIAVLSAADMQSSDWKEFTFEINEWDSTRVIFNSDIVLDSDTRIWIDDLSLRGMTNVGVPQTDLNSVKVYPNPVRDILSIQSDLQVYESIEIYNIKGQKLYSNKIVEEITRYNFSEYEPGIYIIRLIGNKSISTARVHKH